MKLILERHAYAPELSVAHILNPRGKVAATIPARGAQSIKQARAMLARPVTPAIVATICKTYPAPWQGLNAVKRGTVESRKQALDIAKAWRSKEQGGPLVNGDTLPVPKITVSTCLKCL